jgi:GntR family transcriptional regulator
VRRGKPLLYIEEIDYGRDGTPVMLSREWHVSEAFDVRVNRKAHTGDKSSLPVSGMT